MYLYRRRQNYFGTGVLAFIAGAAVWALIGPKVKEKIQENSDFQDMKRDVMNKIRGMGDVTREKYDSVVDEVAANYGKLRGISQNELRDLAADLKFHWYRIKDAWNRES